MLYQEWILNLPVTFQHLYQDRLKYHCTPIMNPFALLIFYILLIWFANVILKHWVPWDHLDTVLFNNSIFLNVVNIFLFIGKEVVLLLETALGRWTPQQAPPQLGFQVCRRRNSARTSTLTPPRIWDQSRPPIPNTAHLCVFLFLHHTYQGIAYFVGFSKNQLSVLFITSLFLLLQFVRFLLLCFAFSFFF